MNMKNAVSGLATFARRSALRAAGLALAVMLGTVPLASATTIIVGAPADPGSGNCFPFGCPFWAPDYQQVYASSNFSGPITITGLTFYNTQGEADNGFNPGTYTISLSSTSKPVNGLDLADLSNNIGADNTVVFSGILPQGPIPVGGDQTITFATPFTYDPGSGLNLLLYVQSADPGDASSFFDARNGTAGGLFSRAMTPGCCAGFEDWGLVTGFVVEQVTPVPEPSSIAILGFTLAGLGWVLVYRRQKPVP